MKRAVVTMASAALIASALGCGKTETNTPAPQPSASGSSAAYAGTLDVEIRETSEVAITEKSDGSVDVAIQLPDVDAAGLVEGGKLTATGRVERFPEAQSELTTAKISLPAIASGPCGAEPISLALSLHRRGENLRFAGGLTAYCGADHFYGVPAKILRLSGVLERKK